MEDVSFSLDGDGRTRYDPALRPPESSTAATSTAADGAKRAKIEAQSDPAASLDYASKTTQTSLSSLDPSLEAAMDALLFDAEITDCGLLPRTFWVPSTGFAPRTFCEKMALEVFRHHVPEGLQYDPERSGAEWWVQLRPSPPGTGRYSMLATDMADDDMAKSGISFHWDKDEDLRLLCGGTMYVHPHLSTVTYLTDLGAPTVVLSKRVDPMTGQFVEEASPVEGMAAWPRRGKHLSFDGRYLHAAPSDLMEHGAFEKQCRFDVAEDLDETAKKALARRHRRVTFLVNIWLNHRPLNVKPFPESMVEKLSKSDLFGEQFVLFGGGDGNEKEPRTTKTVIVQNGKASIAGAPPLLDSKGDEGVKLTKMTWPMGQKDEETIDIPLPVELIREQGESGRDVAMTWHDGVVLGGTSA
ncbi:hypothetical protein ACHAXT_004250 [Thalassiosira profunda]